MNRSMSMLIVFAGVGVMLAACSHGGVSTASAINITPLSNPSDPINLSKNNLYPGNTATLHATESGYAGIFNAVADGSCISVSPVLGSKNEFTVANASDCGGGNVRVVISDTFGRSATAYVTNF
jgi:hypothetical protein